MASGLRSTQPSVKPRKVRLDELLVARGLAESRSQAQRLILAGEVSVGDRVLDKAGHMVPENADVRVATGSRYVSRGGLKLEHALHAFAVDPSGWTCADIGASTGGFTDCLLQYGALKVYAIDVIWINWRSLRQDRVLSLERANIRQSSHCPNPCNQPWLMSRSSGWTWFASMVGLRVHTACDRPDQATVSGRQRRRQGAVWCAILPYNAVRSRRFWRPPLRLISRLRSGSLSNHWPGGQCRVSRTSHGGAVPNDTQVDRWLHDVLERA
jgi:ribosomal 50S subunit-recycling heat shock protein